MAGVESMTARERRLTDYFRSTEAWHGPGSSSDAARTPVFLVGFPRSGTTLLEQVLAAHPAVEAMEEHPCLADSATAFFGSGRGA